MDHEQTSLPSGFGQVDSWPEAIRREPRTPDPFPFRLVVLGALLPLGLGLLVISALALLVRNNAQRPLVYWSENGEFLWTTSRDRNQSQTVGDSAPIALPTFTIGPKLRLLSGAAWSPQGDRLAVTKTTDEGLQVAIFSDLAAAPQSIASQFEEKLIAVPGSAWSPDGNSLALLEHDPARPLLTLVNLAQGQATPFAFTVETRAGFSWDPRSRGVLVTASVSETVGMTPTLLIAMRDGADLSGLLPDDGLAARFNGAFSPDGAQIAYLGVQTYTLPTAATNPFLLGSLWIMSADSSQPRQLVAGEHNSAPIWLSNGRALLYTRFDPATNRPELRRVDATGQNDRRIGPGNRMLALYPLDRNLFLQWSPDGGRLAFLAEDNGRISLYIAAATGEDAQPLGSGCPTGGATLTWMPTGKAVLLSCENGRNNLYWIDGQRNPTAYPSGYFPAWKP